jgi:hypothetical protein
VPEPEQLHSSLSVEIDAPPELVFRLARDPRRWPALLPHYQRARVVDTAPDGGLVVEFVARRSIVPVLGLGVPVAWRSRTWAEPDTLRLRFRHLGGATGGMDVTWRIEPGVAGPGSRVTIEHDFAPRFAPWAAFVDRLFTRAIAGRTLASFRALAESLAPDASDAARATNRAV